MKTILIIEDEDSIRLALEDDFRHEGFKVETAADGRIGFRKAMDKNINMIILDIMLPEMNGFDICTKLRMQGIKTPIIMLTAKGQEIDRVLGLELGADDYVTKPFSPRELHARVKAIFRRMEKDVPETEYFSFEPLMLKVDFLLHECFKRGKLINLTKSEFGILKYMIINKERVIDRDELLDEIWGKDVIVAPRTVDTHLANLRKKIEDNPAAPKLILSVRGMGYKLSHE